MMKREGIALGTLPAVLGLVVLVIVSCRKDEAVQPHVSSIQVSFEDASCTEAWLRVSLADASEPRTVGIQQDGRRVLTARLVRTDSVLVVDGLLPHGTYSFAAQRISDTTAIETSEPVQATTMDTTSHDWVFTVDTLGVTASNLQDVSIVSDTLAYAVGELYELDSLGVLDPFSYNLVKWDGLGWRPDRATVTFRGNSVSPPMEGVFALSATDVWLAGSIPIHWNGEVWVGYDIQSLVGAGATVSRGWGNGSDLYFVGRTGNALHYDNVVWRRIESGTSLPLRQVFGAKRPQTLGYEILCIADGYGSAEGSKVLSIEGNTVREVWNDPRPYGLDAIWFVPRRRYVVVGSGVWITRSPTANWSMENSLPMIHMTSIAGQGLNDFVVCGAFGLVAHYNGVNWRSYFPMDTGAFTSVAIRGNLMIAVGGTGDRAIIARGVRGSG